MRRLSRAALWRAADSSALALEGSAALGAFEMSPWPVLDLESQFLVENFYWQLLSSLMMGSSRTEHHPHSHEGRHTCLSFVVLAMIGSNDHHEARKSYYLQRPVNQSSELSSMGSARYLVSISCVSFQTQRDQQPLLSVTMKPSAYANLCIQTDPKPKVFQTSALLTLR